MLHIAIVEDNAETRAALAEAVRRYAAQRSLELTVHPFPDGDALLESYPHPCDILLLDIELPGRSGMEIARAVRGFDRNVVLLFITNMAQYAIQGYEVDALDYVLKPVSDYTLGVKLDRAVTRLHQNTEGRILIPLPTGAKVFATSAIHYVETLNGQLHYHTAEGVFSVRGTLQSVEKELAPWHFARCNQCYLVNLGHVTGIRGDDVLVEDVPLAISRRCKPAFLAAVADYVGGRG